MLKHNPFKSRKSDFIVLEDKNKSTTVYVSLRQEKAADEKVTKAPVLSMQVRSYAVGRILA